MLARMIDEVGVVNYCDQIVDLFEEIKALYTPEYREWLREYDKEKGTSLGRKYDGVAEFFDDRETLMMETVLSVKLEELQRELLQYLCFGLSQKEIQRSHADLLHRYTIVHRGYWFNVLRDRIWVKTADEVKCVPAGHGEEE